MIQGSDYDCFLSEGIERIKLPYPVSAVYEKVRDDLIKQLEENFKLQNENMVAELAFSEMRVDEGVSPASYSSVESVTEKASTSAALGSLRISETRAHKRPRSQSPEQSQSTEWMSGKRTVSANEDMFFSQDPPFYHHYGRVRRSASFDTYPLAVELEKLKNDEELRLIKPQLGEYANDMHCVMFMHARNQFVLINPHIYFMPPSFELTRLYLDQRKWLLDVDITLTRDVTVESHIQVHNPDFWDKMAPIAYAGIQHQTFKNIKAKGRIFFGWNEFPEKLRLTLLNIYLDYEECEVDLKVTMSYENCERIEHKCLGKRSSDQINIGIWRQLKQTLTDIFRRVFIRTFQAMDIREFIVDNYRDDLCDQVENLTNIANNRIDKLWNVVLEIIKKQNSDYITLKHYEGVIKNHLPSATPRTTKFYSGIVHATEAKFGSLLSLERYGNWSMFEDGNEIILFGNMKFKHFSYSIHINAIVDLLSDAGRTYYIADDHRLFLKITIKKHIPHPPLKCKISVAPVELRFNELRTTKTHIALKEFEYAKTYLQMWSEGNLTFSGMEVLNSKIQQAFKDMPDLCRLEIDRGIPGLT